MTEVEVGPSRAIPPRGTGAMAEIETAVVRQKRPDSGRSVREVIDIHHHGDNDESEGGKGNAQTDKTIFEKTMGLPIEGRGKKVARKHEKEAHEERAVYDEKVTEYGCLCRLHEIPPPSRRTVRLAGVVGDDERDEGNPQVIDEEEPWFSFSLNDTLLNKSTLTQRGTTGKGEKRSQGDCLSVRQSAGAGW
jgi:hypothetical protein